MIPKILHQTWKTQQLPQAFQYFRNSWKTHHPEWTYCLYDDTQCREFVQTHFPELLATYDTFPTQIQRADFFRYIVIYKDGGVYADLDMECLKSFTPLLAEEILLCIETKISTVWQHQLGYQYPFQIANCIFAAQPGHWFLQKLIQTVQQGVSQRIQIDADIEDVTGPRMLTRLVYALSDHERRSLNILSQIVWMPPTLYPNIWPLNRYMYARHHFWGSWKIRRTVRKSFRQRWLERSKLPNPWPRRFHIFQEDELNLGRVSNPGKIVQKY